MLFRYRAPAWPSAGFEPAPGDEEFVAQGSLGPAAALAISSPPRKLELIVFRQRAAP
jgi:hypothetical protein